MRFNPDNCPECGGTARGTVETLPGVAEMDEVEPGVFEYTGHTNIGYDGQETVCNDGQVTLTCVEGHEWFAEMEGD